jgi:predicted AlkP superfamily pyrophosphatase or phosphodiesterase
MKLRSVHTFVFIALIQLAYSQVPKKTTVSAKPKLIVGIVVDQMRNDYIYRYWDRYGNGGFKKLVNNGFYLRNAHFNYVPTYTGPGHSSIYTGTTPRTHGIIANEWYDKDSKEMLYCVDDKKVNSVGTLSEAGKRSPVSQISSTIGDELKITSNGRSKVFGIALKDRSSILPAGHSADAAFWYDDSTGYFVSSSWYVKELPQWLNDFNALNYPQTHLQKGWNTLKPIETYTNSISDNNTYEKASNKKETPTFPYDYAAFIKKKSLGILKATPYGNTITKDLAIACLKSERLGKDEFPDILAISFSSPDIIAHSYGPRSVEMEDVYLRLDLDIEELIKTLDAEVGANNYVIFLTADHGGADVAAHLSDEQIPADLFKTKSFVKNIKDYFQKNYSDSTLFVNYSNEQIFLDDAKLLKLNKTEIEQRLCDHLLTINGIAEAYPSIAIKNNGFEKRDIRTLIQNGYNHKKSGNVAFVLNPAWMENSKTGTTHGAAYSYDTHVPLIFYGNGIKKGSSLNYYRITQIAPTISDLLKINYPNGCTDDAIDKLIIKDK